MDKDKNKKLKRMNESAFGWATSILVSAFTAIIVTVLFHIALR